MSAGAEEPQATLAVGTRYEMVPAPPVDADTQYIDAGAVRIGVEYRVLTEENLLDAYADDERGAAIIQAAKLPVVDESGVSLHVMDASTGGEVLRFDLLDDHPHYHESEREARRQRGRHPCSASFLGGTSHCADWSGRRTALVPLPIQRPSIHPRGFNTVVAYDSTASGPMFDWAVAALRTRLRAMLRVAGAAPLADRVDDDVLQRAMIEVVAIARRAIDARTGGHA